MSVLLENLSSLPPRLKQWETQLQAARLTYGVGGLLLAAHMDRESRGGEALTPKGAHGKGDRGRGHGLMQIDIGSHEAFLAAKFDDGRPVWADPSFNVLYAARLIRRNLDALRSNLPAAIAAYNCGLGRVQGILRSLPLGYTQEELVKTLDPHTAGSKKNPKGDYVSDVLGRLKKFTLLPEDAPNA